MQMYPSSFNADGVFEDASPRSSTEGDAWATSFLSTVPEATNETSSSSRPHHHPSSHHSSSPSSHHASAANELSLSSRLNEPSAHRPDASLSAHSAARAPAGPPRDGRERDGSALSRGGDSSTSSQGGDASRSARSAPGSGGGGRGGGRMRSLLEEGEVAAESLMGILDEAERMQDEGGGGGGGGASELSVLASEGLRDRQAGGGGGAARGKGLHPPQADNAGFPNVSLIEQDSSFGGYTLHPNPKPETLNPEP